MTDFTELGLSPTTLEAVAATGYTTATPIQEQAIPVALAGLDVLGIAQTGTGKTAAFTLPMIDRLKAGRSRANMPRALVLAPTRELADQVAESFKKYAKGTRLNWALLIGGVSMGDQLSALSKGVDVLIATPGRLLDLYERGKILMLGVQIMVVDEADRMLDMGFIPDLERIFNLTPKTKQTLFFSATMPPEITRLTTQFLRDPTRIEASRPASVVDTITQYAFHIPLGDPKAKRLALRALVERAAPESGIVFCNRKTDVDVVAKSLKVHGFDAAPIHGDLDQSLRTKTLEAFRKGELRLLVASDVAARGLDIPAVSHVFNYDVPFHADDYVHRIGRTGRAGRSGEALMIVTPNDDRNFDKVVKLIKTTPERLTLELDWSQAEGGERSSRDRPGRERAGRDRARPERPTRDRAERPRREPQPVMAAETEAPEAIALSEVAAETAAERPARAPRARRPARPERAPVEAAVAPEVADEAERPVRLRREPVAPSIDRASAPDRSDRAERGVVGFGSEVPAFLAAALPARKPALVED